MIAHDIPCSIVDARKDGIRLLLLCYLERKFFSLQDLLTLDFPICYNWSSLWLSIIILLLSVQCISGPWFNIKMLSYQCGNKTAVAMATVSILEICNYSSSWRMHWSFSWLNQTSLSLCFSARVLVIQIFLSLGLVSGTFLGCTLFSRSMSLTISS